MNSNMQHLFAFLFVLLISIELRSADHDLHDFQNQNHDLHKDQNDHDDLQNRNLHNDHIDQNDIQNQNHDFQNDHIDHDDFQNRDSDSSHHDSDHLPSVDDLMRVLFLKGYNTRLVVLSVSLLGFSCGLVGGFLLLRKRALMGDALSHATLPGICLAFLVMIVLGGNGKALAGLLIGAAFTGMLGFGTMMAIRKGTRIKDDAAMGIVLSVFFGAGAALQGTIQKMPENAAGLQSFIYGKTASMVWDDFLVLMAVALLAFLISIVLFKEFRLLCFDEGFAESQGWSVGTLDMILLSLVTMVTVAGLQAVGLILVIAFLITPAAAARFWTHRLSTMLWIGALIGAMSGWIGASFSSLFPRLPAGAIIVLSAAGFFLMSMFFGRAGGILVRALRQRRLKRKMGRQHLLRAAYEWLESHAESQIENLQIQDSQTQNLHTENLQTQNFQIQNVQNQSMKIQSMKIENVPIQMKGLLSSRSWSIRALRREIRSAQKSDLVKTHNDQSLLLSNLGFDEAAKVVRNHRLWELYLIENADIAPNHVDRDADAVEHVLGEALVAQLEKLLPAYQDAKRGPMPDSPHPIVKGFVKGKR